MTSMTGRPDLAAALCEVCCHARTVKFSWGSSWTPRGYDYQDGTCDLKCEACGRITRHALVLPAAEAGGRYEAQEFHEARPSASVGPFADVRRTVLEEDLDLAVASEGDENGGLVHLEGDWPPRGESWDFIPREARALAAALLEHADRAEAEETGR